MNLHTFNDQEVNWQRLEVFDNFQYSVLDIDRTNKVVEVIFKFAANDPIVLHRHCALNHTFVIQGEHCLYHADGTLKETRPTGSYTVSPPDTEPHRECGGDEDTIVLFSIRGTEGTMYEILDDDQNIIAKFTMDEFEGLYQAQQASNKAA